jgi:hypothetical protein
MSDARTIIEKADVAVSDLLDGGKLNPTQSDEFYRMVMDQPTILNEIRTVQMPSDKYNIDKIGFGSRMWRAAPSSGTALASEDRYRPAFDQIQLDVKEILSEFHIPDDVLEDSIEKGTLQQTFMQMAAKRTSVDLQELLVLGDTSSNDPFLALVDGALQLPDHTLDGSSLSAIDKELWKNTQQAMPSKYLTELEAMGFYLSPNNVINYRYTLAGQNADVGYNYYTGRPELNGFGVPVKQVSHMPDTKMLFTYPENIIMGIHRDVRIETDRDIRRRALIVVMTARIDVKMEEPNAAVVVNGLNVT